MIRAKTLRASSKDDIVMPLIRPSISDAPTHTKKITNWMILSLFIASPPKLISADKSNDETNSEANKGHYDNDYEKKRVEVQWNS